MAAARRQQQSGLATLAPRVWVLSLLSDNILQLRPLVRTWEADRNVGRASNRSGNIVDRGVAAAADAHGSAASACAAAAA